MAQPIIAQPSSIVSEKSISQPHTLERQVKILTNTPLETRLFSYGKALSGIVYAFFSLFMPLIYAIFGSFRSHFTEMINLKGDLAQNKFDVLQEVLEASNYEDIVGFVDRGDREGFREHFISFTSREYGQEEVAELAKSLFLPTLYADVKSQALELVQDKALYEEIEAIDVDDPHLFLRIAEKKVQSFPLVEKRLKLLHLAVSKKIKQRDQEAKCKMQQVLYSAGFEHQKLQKTIDSLAIEGCHFQNIEQFLIGKGIFGKDPSNSTFQAGLFLLNQQLGSIRDKQLIAGFYFLIESLRNSTDEDQFGFHVGRQIRNLASLASFSPIYQELNEQFGRSNVYVSLLQDLCSTLHMRVPGARELRQLGGLYLNQIQEKHGPIPEEGKKVTYLAKAMDEALEKHKKFSFESFKDKALTDRGNFDIGVGCFQLGNRSIQAAFGPIHKSDQAFEAHLASLKERGGIHLHQGLVDSPESLRKLEGKYPSVLRVFSMPLDGITSKLSGKKRDYFLDFKTPEEFLLKYTKFALCNQTEEDASYKAPTIRALTGDSHLHIAENNDNGFYFSRDVMSTHQFRLGFEKAAQAFTHVDPAQEDKERVAHALQLGAQGFLTVGAIVKTLQDLPVDRRDDFMTATFKQAFERNVDRGIVMNVLTEVYFHLLSGEPLSEDVMKEMIGTVIARAELIVGHEVTLSDYQMLSDLLRMIGADENRVRGALQDYLREGFDVDGETSCRFSPFISQAPDRAKRKKITTEKEIFEARKRFKPIRNKGSYGSIIYMDREGKPYGIFKSIDAHFSMDKRVKSKVIDMMGITEQEGYLPLSEMRQVGAMISERATYLLDQVLLTHSVPKTEIIYAQGHKGSFQHFVHGYKEAEEVVLPAKEGLNKSDINKYQRFVILDYLLGNLDRKLDNWMVKLTSDGRHFKDIKGIDNANCYPKGHLPKPGMLDGSTWYQYAWKDLDLSTIPLSQDMVKFIDSLTDVKLDSIISLWKSDLGPEYFESFFGGSEGEAIKALKDRVRVLRKFAEESRTNPRTLRELASYNTYEAIKEYLGETLASQATYVLPTYS